MQRASEMLGRFHRLRVGERLVAVSPTKRNFVRFAGGTIGQ
jgi:CelD/BcsL family acetyltransferase involved in cellulose biosynthesis